MSPPAHRRYVVLMLLTWVGLVGAVFVFNSLLDPLWHFGGNRLTGKNYAFDERTAKINRFLQTPDAFDCVIFGSSRATLMPEDAFAPYRCVNLAFSSGQVDEFVAYAQYLKKRGFSPRLLVVGVDGFVLRKGHTDPVTIPGFITAFSSPPNVFMDYLSLGSLALSWRAFRNNEDAPRYYNTAFQGIVAPHAPRFRPEHSLEAEGLRRAQPIAPERFVPDKARDYAKLIAVFPQARVLGYVPPISAWHTERMAAQDALTSYTQTLHAVAAHFPVFIDFSIPSPLTWRTANTYDGSHYRPAVNAQMARDLLTGKSADGIDVKTCTASDYARAYREALRRFQSRPASQPHL